MIFSHFSARNWLIDLGSYFKYWPRSISQFGAKIVGKLIDRFSGIGSFSCLACAMWPDLLGPVFKTPLIIFIFSGLSFPALFWFLRRKNPDLKVREFLKDIVKNIGAG
jgi:hypothetical protein